MAPTCDLDHADSCKPNKFTEPYSYEVSVKDGHSKPDSLNGIARATDANGAVMIQGNFVEGKRYGAWHYYKPDGSVRATEYWQAHRLVRTVGEDIIDYSGFGYSGGSRPLEVELQAQRLTVRIVIQPLWQGPEADLAKLAAVRMLFGKSEQEVITRYVTPHLSATGAVDSIARYDIVNALNEDYDGVVAKVVIEGATH